MGNFIPVNLPSLKGNEVKYLQECIETGWISSEGPFVKRFEAGFSRLMGCRHGVAVCNGTAALELAIGALRIGLGDEVILPTFTIISCAAAVVRAGATPVLVDCQADTWNMDPALVASRITKRTKAIMAVHLYGLPVDMDPILDLSRAHGLFVIEDAAEQHGQTYMGRPVGSLGDIATVSFYPNKQITTGEGGMVVTNDDALAERCRSLRNLCFDRERRYIHRELGWNFRMSNLQAAVGVAQLEQIDATIAKKRQIGRWYGERLAGHPLLQLPVERTNYAENIVWVYGVVLNESVPFDAAEAIARLRIKGVDCRHFFWPMHEQPVLRDLGLFAGDRHPNAERIARRGFYLPSGVGLTEAEADASAHALRNSAMSVFGAYAKYYDQLYRDKDYAAEADFVHALAQEFVPGASTLLDLGCGTGQHALLLAERGYSVVGVDRSEEMLAAARARLATDATAPDHRVEFAAGDIREVRLGQAFDVTAALFHVMSYQATNEDLAAAFETARVHTRPGGVFIFDCWFGPGVLSDPPQVRLKRLPPENGVDIVRITEPRLRPLENRVDIEFSLIAMNKTSGCCEEVRETHTMRYLFASEIEMLARAHGFDVVEYCQWLKRQEPDATSWNACVVAHAR